MIPRDKVSQGLEKMTAVMSGVCSNRQTEVTILDIAKCL